MIKEIIDKCSEISDTLVSLDNRLGFKKLVRYVMLILLVLFVVNFKTVTKNIVEVVIEISNDIHAEKMRMRDEYMTELIPLLSELRTSTGADRALYFEFHNSEENLEGLPFKFFDLMKCSSSYGINEVYGGLYKDVNASLYTEIFNQIRQRSVLFCKGKSDSDFRGKYTGFFEFVNATDHSEQQVIFGVPGVKKPIGFILLEWMSDSTNITCTERTVREYVPRITALTANNER